MEISRGQDRKGQYKPPAGWRIYWNHQGVHATNDELWLFRPPPFWRATNDIEKDIEKLRVV